MMEQRITARKNPLLQQVKRLLSSKKEREASGLFVSDGTKLLQEAVRWYDGLDTVILSDLTVHPERARWITESFFYGEVLPDQAPYIVEDLLADEKFVC